MVLAERSEGSQRRVDTSSPNGHLNGEDGSDDPEDYMMRVGADYQAAVPDLISGSEPCPDYLPERALLVWAPCADIPDSSLEDYMCLAKEKYSYNAEQALGMLFWHKYDLEKAVSDLPNFTPFPDEWTVEDKVLFEQAFQFHGKNFHKIRQMLPDKTIPSLVKYYYSWKKTRTRTSLMDRQARRLAHKEEVEGGGGANSENASENESDAEGGGASGSVSGADATSGAGSLNDGKEPCSHCGTRCATLNTSPKGGLCSACHQHWKRTGVLRSSSGLLLRKYDGKGSNGKGNLNANSVLRYDATKEGKRKPPKGMYLKHDDLLAIATGPPNQGDTILKAMDAELVSIKRQVQLNKAAISQLKQQTVLDIERPPELNARVNSRWTNEELLLAVQGIRKYGRDFKAIAEVIGNKTESHVRSFFVNYRRRYNLDDVLNEYDQENGGTSLSQQQNTDITDNKDATIADATAPQNGGSGAAFANGGGGAASPSSAKRCATPPPAQASPATRVKSPPPAATPPVATPTATSN